MKKALLFAALVSLILGACTSKKTVSVGNLEFRYPSNYEIVSNEMSADSTCVVYRFENKKDSVGFMYLQVVKEDTTHMAFREDTCALSKMKPRVVGKYLAEKAFEVYQAQAHMPDSITLEYDIESADDLRVLIDDPKVVEVGAFVKDKQDKKDKQNKQVKNKPHFSSGIRATIFGGYRIIAYAQSVSDENVDGFFEIYTSVRDLSKKDKKEAKVTEEPKEKPAPQADSQELPAAQGDVPAEPAQN